MTVLLRLFHHPLDAQLAVWAADALTVALEASNTVVRPVSSSVARRSASHAHAAGAREGAILWLSWRDSVAHAIHMLRMQAV